MDLWLERKALSDADFRLMALSRWKKWIHFFECGWVWITWWKNKTAKMMMMMMAIVRWHTFFPLSLLSYYVNIHRLLFHLLCRRFFGVKYCWAPVMIDGPFAAMIKPFPLFAPLVVIPINISNCCRQNQKENCESQWAPKELANERRIFIGDNPNGDQ